MPLPEAMDRRREILEHAMELIQESGLAALTMKEVARRVGFSEPAAYRYFPTKQALLKGLAERMREMLVVKARAIVMQDDVSPSDRLERIIRHHIDFVIQTDGFPVLILAEVASVGNEEVVSALRSIVNEYLSLLEGLLGLLPGQQLGVRPREQALLLLGLPATIAFRRRLGGDAASEERVKSELLPFVIQCLGGSEQDPGEGQKTGRDSK